jgi:hypothetical protein
VAKSEANNTILRGRNSPTGRHFVPHKSNRKYRRRNTYPNTSSFLTLRGGISRYPRCLYSCFVGSTKTKYCFRRDAVVRVAQCDYYRAADRVLIVLRTSWPNEYFFSLGRHLRGPTDSTVGGLSTPLSSTTQCRIQRRREVVKDCVLRPLWRASLLSKAPLLLS